MTFLNEFQIINGKLMKYTGKSEEVTVPDETDVIEAKAFASNKYIKKVNIPDSVTGIGMGAFINCEALEEVTLPAHLVTLGKSAFAGCTNLKTLSCPPAVKKKLGAQMLSAAIISDKNVVNFLSGAEPDKELEEIFLSYLTKKAGRDKYLKQFISENRQGEIEALLALQKNMKPEELDVYISMTEEADMELNTLFIEAKSRLCTDDGMFGVNDLSLLLGVAEKTADDWKKEFKFRVKGSSAVITGRLTSEEVLAIPNKLGKYTVTEIGANAFEKDETLKEVYIADTVKNIGDRAFAACRNLDTVYFGAGTEALGKSVFSYCPALKSLELPESLTSVGEEAFSPCAALESVAFAAKKVKFTGCNTFRNCVSLKSFVFPSETGETVPGMFDNCFSLESVVLPVRLTSVADNLFFRCALLESVVIPASVTKIGDHAFAFCKNLEKLAFPPALRKTGVGFCEYSGIRTVTLPHGITEISDSAFEHCLRLEKVGLPDSLISVGCSAFAFCTSLKEILIPDSVTEIDDEAFKYCVELKKAVLPDGLEMVSGSVFDGCSKLAAGDFIIVDHYLFRYVGTSKDVLIPPEVTHILPYAFSEDRSIETVCISSGTVSIGESAFAGCTKLNAADFPDTLLIIGEKAFSGCKKLVDIVLPYSVNTVEADAFTGCTGLKTVTVQNPHTEINTWAFNGVSSAIFYGSQGGSAGRFAAAHSMKFNVI